MNKTLFIVLVYALSSLTLVGKGKEARRLAGIRAQQNEKKRQEAVDRKKERRMPKEEGNNQQARVNQKKKAALEKAYNKF